MTPAVHPGDPAAMRIRLTLAVVYVLLALLVWQLWDIQVSSATEYADSVYRQTVRRVRLPGYRGRILDREGLVLADNRPSYCVGLYIEEFRQPGAWDNTVREVGRVIGDISSVIGLEAEVTDRDIRLHIDRRLPLPLFAWKDISRRAMSRLAERLSSFPGVEIMVDPVRIYPEGETLAHVLGYVRKVGPRSEGSAWPLRDEHGDYHFYIPEMEGTRGVEKSCNETLMGKAGGRLIRVDATGYQRRLVQDRNAMHERRPERGGDVYLAIDLRVQRLVEQVLAGRPGAAVVLNPRNGDVLAVASAPSFDPNEFIPAISTARWAVIRDDAGKPLHNRAVSGLYPPGSTFKPVVAIAALQNELVEPSQEYGCPGYYDLGTARLHCWISRYGRGHGAIDMHEAFEQSCNTYFCELAVHSGYDVIYHTAAAMGLGHRTGIGIEGEQRGNLPTAREVRSRGDLANISIGQGAVAVTPVQMAMVTATIANGGRVFRPRLILRETQRGSSDVRFHAPELVRDLQWSAQTRETVRHGMLEVIHSRTGTGKRALVEGLQMAGKTGTAEIGPRDARRKRGWMIAFAPYAQPEYAVAIVLDDAVSGGVDVGPLMQTLMTGLFFPERLNAPEPDADVPGEGVQG